MTGMTFLFAAYSAVWLALFLYIVRLSRRQVKLDREIETLRQIVEERKRRSV